MSAALLLSACGQAANTAETAATADAPAAVTETAAQTTAPKTTPGGVDKSETVYAKANADGTVTETTVEAVLKARDGATIPDVAALRDIINKEGDEEYTTGADNALTWQNSGSAITYEGKSDAALPVTTRVTYYLNGVETAPDDLVGQSGRVRIRFDYTNHTRETVTVDGQEYTGSVPFTAITAVILDGDKFSNIEADNGKVMELDGQTAVLGTVMPGLADGAQELYDGVQGFSDKSSGDLSDDFGSGLRNVVRRLKAVRQAGKNYQTFSGLPAGSTGSVKFIVETAEIKK
ncbi:MAG: hypothetical protein SPH66_09745 [Gemmiger sp.]|uniref:hypothetical protein n=1 Tax=Gemmiger sp. TaxID=2049027 RepID=UPI002A91203A|nr:hypothetical protein [Gemmiger sp.]MDY5204230.1 hypothetical protein [Gemmiger sp.]